MAILLPAAIVEALVLNEGDDVEVVIAGGHELHIKKKRTGRALLDRLRQYRGRLPADFTFNRDDANRVTNGIREQSSGAIPSVR